MSAPPPLVLAPHGSADPRSAEVIEAIAELVEQRRPDLDVRVGYLGHGTDIAEVADARCVVVPLLLTNGYHARRDIAARVGATVTAAVGPDRRLTEVLVQRLVEAGWAAQRPVALAAVGSAEPRALADARQATRDLGEQLGLEVSTGFLATGQPRLADLRPAAVATYLLAPGRFFDEARGCGAEVVAQPLGAHPLFAEIALDRYTTASGRMTRVRGET